MAATSAGMGPLISAWITTVFPSAGIISITFTRKFGTAFGNARQMRSMPPRIGTTLSRPYCAVCTKSEHAVDIVGLVCGEKLFGDRQELCGVRFHVSAFWDRFCCGVSGLVFKPLAERLDLFLRVGREQMFDCHVRRRD